jgi:L-aminopeptidase/D-esterase-like protein
MNGTLTDVAGVTVGHATDLEGITGCTAILCEAGAVGGVDARGTATGVLGLDHLSPLHLVRKVHGILLAGGSAFGLASVGGMMRYLEERGIGFDVRVARVPIVAAAILFDLSIGDPRRRPDAAMAYEACRRASGEPVQEGSVGAGTGATVGKVRGLERAMKGGLGSASTALPGGVIVAALAAVNAIGDIRDPATGRLVAGTRAPEGRRTLADSAHLLREGMDRRVAWTGNTTLAVIATNARLAKTAATKVAQVGHDGLARAISPVHTTVDGDTVFALATGQLEADLDAICVAGAEVVASAVLRAVMTAASLGGVPAWKELFGG